MRHPIAPAGRLRLAALLLSLAVVGGCDCDPAAPLVPVNLPPLSAVVVTPATDTLRVGERRIFTAVAYDTLGQPVAAVLFNWSSSNPAVAGVELSGRVTGLGEGTALIIAEAGGRRDTATVFVYPDTGWFAQVSNTTRNLHGVHVRPDGRNGWAVGAAGAIVSTNDAGATWTTNVSGTSLNLNAVWFTGGSIGWIAGNAGTLLRTGDGGATWTRVGLGVGQNLMDVVFVDPDTGWVVGSSGLVLSTVDGGVTWRDTIVTGTTLRGVSAANGREAWAVSSGGEIFGTRDGRLWYRVQPSVTAQALRSVWRRDAQRAWAVGAAGVAPRTVAGPDSVVWELRNAGAANQLEAVHFPADMIGYAVGYNGSGAVLRTDDAGVTWQNQISRTSRQLNDVYFVDVLRGWAVGDGGVIVHTARGGLR